MAGTQASGGAGSEAAREIARLTDEAEQLRTALEAAEEEASRLTEDRDRLLRRVTALSRDLQGANALYQQAGTERPDTPPDALALLQASEEQEELRVAFEEMQVLTEELEAANASLHEHNRALDRRVEERTRELAHKNQALLESELRFRTLVEGMPQLIWRSAPGGHWTWASPQWIAYTGLSNAESQDHGWLHGSMDEPAYFDTALSDRHLAEIWLADPPAVVTASAPAAETAPAPAAAVPFTAPSSQVAAPMPSSGKARPKCSSSAEIRVTTAIESSSGRAPSSGVSGPKPALRP